jgi:hypothetical protein
MIPDTFGSGLIACRWQRLHAPAPGLNSDPQRGPWLLSIEVSRGEGGNIDAWMPQTRAVIDNFGNLVLLEQWR